MRFGDPQFLQYVLLIIIIVSVFYIWAVSRYKRTSVKFAQKELLKKIDPYYDERTLRLRALLNIAAILLIAFSLSRPQWGTYWKEKMSRGIDLFIALDVSKSMLAQDVLPDRITFAKREIRDFVKNLDGDRVGLLAFSGDAFLYCPLTMDYAGFMLALNTIKVGSVARGGTSISELITQAVRDFKWAASGDKILIVVSDGENTEGDVDKALAEARANGIQIFCAGVGTKKGALITYSDEKGTREAVKDQTGKPVRSCLDEEVLKKISSETGGLYMHSSESRSGLDAIYKARLAKVKKKKQEEIIAKSYKERFQIPIGFALLALLTEMVLTIRGRRDEGI